MGTENRDAFKCGYVAVLGRPNVGKSTLMNRLIGSKLAIVSPKPQTTRSTMRGILTTNHAQIIFLDTAGMHRPKDKLGEYMVEAALQTLQDADLVYLMVECCLPSEDERALAERVGTTGKPVFLIINKIDQIRKDAVLPVIDAYRMLLDAAEIIPISASHGDNVEQLLAATVAQLPVSPPYYPEDIMSDQIERDFIAEFIREKLFYNTKDEIPYSSAVVLEDMTEREGGGAHIRASIYVEKDSQKGIIIGNKGAMIKKIGSEARRDIEAFMGYRVYLELQVKVEKKWRGSPKSLRKFGYR